MKPIPLDFGPSADRRSTCVAWIAIAGAVIAAGGLAPRWMEAWSELQAAHDAHRSVVAEGDRREPGAASETPLHAAAEQAIARLQTPWPRMLASIESAGGKHVTLLSLEPNATTGEVRIQAQAKDVPSLITYVRTVSTAPDFSAVQLESHQIQLQHPQQPVDGSIVARWSAQGPPPSSAASATGAP